jgi:predicted amidohydrolase YtcJ
VSNDEQPPGTSTLYRGGYIYGTTGDPAGPAGAAGTTGQGSRHLTAMVVADNRIAWVGPDEAATGHADGVDAVVDLDGALVTPTFVDAHVHTSATGMGLRSVDLTGASSRAQMLGMLETAARKRAGRPVYAPGWDEQDWPERRPPTAREVDRATYGGVVYSPRVDGHCAVISSALAAASGARDHLGWDNSGLVTREAHHAARDAFYGGVSPADRRADIEAALNAAAAAGIGLVHENGGPTLSSEADFADVLAAGHSPVQPSGGAQERRDSPGVDAFSGPEVVGYWGELVQDEELARALAGRTGARGLAGDLNVDGSIGSRTAFLRAPYVDGHDGQDPHGGDRSAHRGNGYLSVEQVRDHVAACSVAGLQGGFHVIGEAGVDLVIEGMQAAAALVGRARLVAARHRLEHLEMVDAAGIRALVELGVTASVQPAFQSRWGGPDGMYAARLGAERTSGMNPFATMNEAGMSLALGSDSPVTPFAPWEAIRSCVNHQNPAQRLSAEAAFLAHTVGGWRAAGMDDHGFLDVGQPASFAIWSTEGLASPGFPDLSREATLPTNLRTVIRGRTVFDRMEVA